MATCAVAVQETDGSYTLRLDPSVTDITTCSYVVQSGADIGNSLLTMTASDGAAISAAIFLVWATAWSFKMFIKTLGGNYEESSD